MFSVQFLSAVGFKSDSEMKMMESDLDCVAKVKKFQCVLLYGK